VLSVYYSKHSAPSRSPTFPYTTLFRSGDGPGLVPHLPEGRTGPERPDRVVPRPHRPGEGAGPAAADPRPRRPPRRARGARGRWRARAHRLPLLLRRRRVRTDLRGPRLVSLLRRHRHLQERRGAARSARRGGSGPGHGRDRRPVPHPGALPRPPELVLPHPAHDGDHRRGDRHRPRARLPHDPHHHAGRVQLARGRGRMTGPEASGAGMLLTARDIRELAEAAGIRPSKQRGQNFVMDPNTVRTIVGRAGVEPGQAVLEVGPGLGSLTLGLLEAGGEVVAVELDRGLAELLPLTLRARGVQEDRFRLVHADALQVTELPALPGAGAPASLVANLPY